MFSCEFCELLKNSCFAEDPQRLVLKQQTEAVVQRCYVKKVFLEISQNSQENTCARVSFFIKFQAGACKFIKKETLAQVSSCEFCEISKNTFFYRTPLVAASDQSSGASSINLQAWQPETL